MKRTFIQIVFFAGILGLWQLLVYLRVWPPVLLPAPAQVFDYLKEAALDGTLLQAIAVTGRRLLLGYAAGVALGLPLGFLTARFQWLSDTAGVLALGIQTLPSVCWIPLAMLWFGQTEAAMLFVVIMGTFGSIVMTTEHGVRSLPPIYSRAARTMGSRGVHSLIYVRFPASLPFVITGMKQGWAFAWRSLMAAEVYVTILTGFGLGHLLHYGRELHAMDQVLGVMFVIVAVGLAADRILFLPFERRIHQRFGTART